MAQTITRASAKRSRGSPKSQARSQGSSGRPRGSKSRASGKAGNASRAQSKKSAANGAARVDSARRAVEEKAKDAGHAVGSAASKAKVPLIAGGAALAGAAGGLALGVHQARHRHGIAAPRRPQLKVNSHDLAKAAKEVGTFGAQMGHLASELQRNREAANGGEKHRSPLEVVLEGLTARR